MTMWGVPGDLELATLPDDVKPWMLVHKIVDWSPAEQPESYEGPDGKEYISAGEVWFPVVLSPCSSLGGHGPATTFYGPMHCSSTRWGALVYAARAIKSLRDRRVQLHRDLDAFIAKESS